MITVPRKTIPSILVLLIAVFTVTIGASPAAAKGSSCKKVGMSVSLTTSDPTQFHSGTQAWVYARPNAKVYAPSVRLIRGGKVYAKGRISGRIPGGRSTVVRLQVKREVGKGKYKLEVKARKGGCKSRATNSKVWKFGAASLPAQAIPYSTRVGDNVGAVRFVVRPVKRASIGPVKVSLINRNGATVASTKIPELGKQQVIASLPIARRLNPGKFRVRLTGKLADGSQYQSSVQKFTFVSGGGGAKPVQTTGQETQKVVVDWYNGDSQGRTTGGFIAPGIGYGQIVCSRDQQWIRFFPSNAGRESAMMTWTYKNWGTYSEKALREAKYSTGTGPDFREGFNKFGPPENWSTGQFQGIISDRGPLEGPGGVALAPPTTFDLDWQWDFSDSKTAKCHVEATFRTQTDLVTKPLARSAQIVWRGEANATDQNTVSSVDFPGLGPVKVQCEAGANGVRRINIGSDSGGKIVDREGSDDSSVTQGQGPLASKLPNNGMLFITLNTGERILVSSRWKVNDPSPSKNWCVISAQVYTG